MSAFDRERWKGAGSLMLADLRSVKSLTGIVLWAFAVLVASVAFLRAQLPNLGQRWAWGIVGAFVVTQFAWYVALAYVRAKPGREGSQHDNRLLDLALDLLPTNGETMRLLCEGSFGVRFKQSQIEPMEQFATEFSAPEREFHDTEAERAKQSLIRAWEDFYSLLWPNVFVDPRPGDDRLGTKYALDYPDLQGTGIPEADKAYEIAMQLDALASRVCDAHREFIEVAVRRIRS